jgi:crotonobetainyl-CoA:carnitine CoA-transferase CaiB-like acyl-CoA transferase
MVKETDHPIEGRVKQLGFPWKFSGTPAVIKSPPPALGEHNTDILKTRGYEEEEIRAFEKDGII